MLTNGGGKGVMWPTFSFWYVLLWNKPVSIFCLWLVLLEAFHSFPDSAFCELGPSFLGLERVRMNCPSPSSSTTENFVRTLQGNKTNKWLYVPQGYSKMQTRESVRKFLHPVKLYILVSFRILMFSDYFLFFFGGGGWAWEAGRGWLKIMRLTWGSNSLWHLPDASLVCSWFSSVRQSVRNAASQAVDLSVRPLIQQSFSLADKQPVSQTIYLSACPSVSQQAKQSAGQSVSHWVSWSVGWLGWIVNLSVCPSVCLSVCPSFLLSASQPASSTVSWLVGQPVFQTVSLSVGWSVYHSVNCSRTKLNADTYLCDGSLSGEIFMTATTFPRSSYNTSLIPGGRPYWACWQKK